jgi:2-polyprenyl-3-methyl-5-hydroxy-6-metoxy-1,4-benzoquinol methylase
MSSPCLICDSRKAASVLLKDNVRGLGRTMQLVRCAQCGHVFADGWPELVDVDAYDYYRDRLQADPRRDALNEARINAMLEHLEGISPGRRLLDVGCGEGHLVEVASRRGWNARGIDFSEPAIAQCRRFDVNAEVLDFFAPALDSPRFDTIVMMELIEHVPAPGRFFARASELLSSGGLLYVTTPNFGALTRRLVGSAWSAIHHEHVSYFNARTLEQLVARTPSLAVLSMKSVNFSPGEVLRALRRDRSIDASGPRKDGSAERTSDQRLRRAIAGVPFLDRAKDAVNIGLDLLGLGDSFRLIVRRT